jgi:hypothetical protein
MRRNEADLKSRKLGPRPMGAAAAVKIAFAIIAANVAFAATKACFHRPAAPLIVESVSTVTPFILPVDDLSGAVPQIEPRTIAVASARN